MLRALLFFAVCALSMWLFRLLDPYDFYTALAKGILLLATFAAIVIIIGYHKDPPEKE